MTAARIATISGWAYPAGVLKALAPEANHFSAFDFFGSSAKPTDTFASTLTAPTCLIGWSLGGMLAIDIALTNPEMVSGLILLNSTSRFCNEPGYPAGISASHLKAMIVGVPMQPEYTLKQFFEFTAVELEDFSNDVLLEQAIAAGTRVLLGGLKHLYEEDRRDQLRDIQCPVLLMHTYDDPVIPADASRFMATRLRDVDLKVFPGKTHACFVQEPEQTREHIRTFLNRLSEES